MTTQHPAIPATGFVERLHGRDVPDPYRWLEDATDVAVQKWMDEQTAAATAWLDGVPVRGAIRDRLRAVWDYPKLGVPWRQGPWWFQMRNTGLQNQSVLWVADAPGEHGRVLLDPNLLSEDGTAALTGLASSHDGSLLAYAVSEHGSDWKVWRVREVATGEDLSDELRWSKFSPAAWHPDGSGFWYGVYDPPDERAAYQEANRAQRLAFHRLGTDQADDETVCEISDDPEWIFSAGVTDDGRWLVVTLHRGTDPRNRVWVADLQGDGVVRPLLDEFDAAWNVAGNDGSTLLLVTDAEAPRRRVVAIDATSDTPEPREVVAQRDETLSDAVVAGGRIVTVWLADASSRLRTHALDGSDTVAVELSAIGSVGMLAAHQDDPVVHFSLVTFERPQSVLRLDVADAAPTLLSAPDFGGDADLVTEQVFVTSADGTRVPMFVVRRADVDPSVPRRTLLWGYGGFNIPVTPMFSPHWYVWMERGGVLAVANLRGGGEYGQEWHDAGRLANKQNVFDDAIACAQWLVDEGRTTPELLAINGGSNGGLLAGACLTQRSDLFGAAVVEVGVLDMLRFHLSTIGWAWKSDYGDPDDPDDFANLLAYSPYHRVVDGTAYPATLVVTGDHDDRVVPSHSFKFAARLQAAQVGDAPILLRVDRSGGHGQGKPTAKVIDERADVLAFLERALREPGGR